MASQSHWQTGILGSDKFWGVRQSPPHCHPEDFAHLHTETRLASDASLAGCLAPYTSPAGCGVADANRFVARRGEERLASRFADRDDPSVFRTARRDHHHLWCIRTRTTSTWAFPRRAPVALASRTGGLAVPRTPEFSRWSFSWASQERTRRTRLFPATRSFAAGGWATGFAKEPARRIFQACATAPASARYACLMLVRRAGATFLILRH